MAGSVNNMDFLLGIVAGEGSFHLTFGRDTRRKYGFYFGSRFRTDMGKFSRPLLESLQDFTDLGTVNTRPKGFTWVISNREECHALSVLIDEHLADHDSFFTRTSKYDSYLKWKEGLEILQPNHQLSKEEIIELAQLKDDINRHPVVGRPAEEIISIIESADASNSGE